MKKIILVFVAVLLVFTMSSCTTEEKEITIIVYSENPQEMVSNLEDLPELLGLELQSLGYEFSRVVVQSSDNISEIESSLMNGLVDMAVLDPTMLTSSTLVRVLDVAMEEMNHPNSDQNPTTYQYAMVASKTVEGEAFKDSYELLEGASNINTVTVCAISENEDLVVLFGGEPINELVNFTSSDSEEELYQGLEDGTCDLGVVKLEEVSDYSHIWEDNEFTVYEELSVLSLFEAVQYQGLYVSTDAEELLTNSLVQSFIQISAHSTNRETLDALGHDSYQMPTE